MWQRLMRARLHGFAGHVFGLLILAALPLYIASTTLIIRTKKPLFEIPLAKKVINLLFPTPAEASTPTPTESGSETTDLIPDESNMNPDIPGDIPAELRPAYIRSRHNMGQTQTSIFNSIAPSQSQATQNNIIANPITDISGDAFPLPSDFDITMETDDTDTIPTFTEMPMFESINFDTPAFTDTDTTTSEPETTDETLEQQKPNTDYKPDLTNIIEQLNKSNKEYQIIDDIIISGTQAIICHTDPDFWVIDSENWFASGKARPSPIKQIIQYAHDHELNPAIYLGATNILDLDKHIKEWNSVGITVITSPDQI